MGHSASALAAQNAIQFGQPFRFADFVKAFGNHTGGHFSAPYQVVLNRIEPEWQRSVGVRSNHLATIRGQSVVNVIGFAGTGSF